MVRRREECMSVGYARMLPIGRARGMERSCLCMVGDIWSVHIVPRKVSNQVNLYDAHQTRKRRR